MAIDLDEITVPNLVHFGSWIGGDRDGNPLVKPDCIRDALEMARGLILREYLSDVESLSDRLSSSRRQTGVSKELLSRLKHYERTDRGRASRMGTAQYDRNLSPLSVLHVSQAAMQPRGRGHSRRLPQRQQSLKTIFC